MFRAPSFPRIAILVLGLASSLCLFPASSQSQALFSDSITADARAAGMGGAFSAIATGPWGGITNPGAYCLPPLFQAGYSYTDLGARNSQADYQSLAANVSLAELAGLGAGRNHLDHGFIERHDQQDRFLGQVNPTDDTEWIGASVDLARIFSRGRSHVSFGLGVNYKHLKRKTMPADSLSLILEEEAINDFDLGALFGIVVPLAGATNDTLAAPKSHLRLSAAVVLRNVGNGQFEVADSDLIEEAGKTTVVGGGAELALGRRTPTRHIAVLRVAAEFRHFEQQRPDDTFTQQLLVVQDSEHYGAELLLGGFVSGRIGYVVDSNRDLSETTYGAGAQLMIPGLRIHVRLDYARVPAQTMGIPAPAAGEAALEDLDRYSGAAWISF